MIETARLWLRPLREDDAAGLFAMYRDPAVARFLCGLPASVEEERGWIVSHRLRYHEARGYGLWAVVVRESGQLIGRCGLLDASAVTGDDELEVAYLLAASHRGGGYATEAAAAVLAFAERSLGRRRVVAFVHRDNLASARVARRLGMRWEGVRPYRGWASVDVFAWSAGPGR